MSGENGEVTMLLDAAAAGDTLATERLFPLVYNELRRLAGAMMSQERPAHTLQPTALVNEAYLRLVGGGERGWESRGHFFGAAARAMRQILVDHARRIRARKNANEVLAQVPTLDSGRPREQAA